MPKINFKGVSDMTNAGLRDYLVYLTDELTYILRNIDRDNLSEEMKKTIERRNADGDV